MELGKYNFIKWFNQIGKRDIANLDFDIKNKKDLNYSKLLLIKEIRPDLMHINDMINYHIKNTKIIKKDKKNIYHKRVFIEQTFLFFWDNSYSVNRSFNSKIILRDIDTKSQFFFRINNFYDSKDKGLCLDISYYPKDKDYHYKIDKDNIDIYEFDEIFNEWIKNIKLFNNFDIEKLSINETIDLDSFFTTNDQNEEKLNQLEIEKFKTFLLALKNAINSKKNRTNSKQVKKIILEIEYIEKNVENFSKKKLKFYVNILGRKILWFLKEITLELIKEIVKRSLLGA